MTMLGWRALAMTLVVACVLPSHASSASTNSIFQTARSETALLQLFGKMTGSDVAPTGTGTDPAAAASDDAIAMPKVTPPTEKELLKKLVAAAGPSAKSLQGTTKLDLRFQDLSGALLPKKQPCSEADKAKALVSFRDAMQKDLAALWKIDKERVRVDPEGVAAGPLSTTNVKWTVLGKDSDGSVDAIMSGPNGKGKKVSLAIESGVGSILGQEVKGVQTDLAFVGGSEPTPEEDPAVMSSTVSGLAGTTQLSVTYAVVLAAKPQEDALRAAFCKDFASAVGVNTSQVSVEFTKDNNHADTIASWSLVAKGNGGGVVKREASFTLDIDFAWVSANERPFKAAFVSDLAVSLDTEPAALSVSSIAPGSSVVKTMVSGASLCDKVGKILPSTLDLAGVAKLASRAVKLEKAPSLGDKSVTGGSGKSATDIQADLTGAAATMQFPSLASFLKDSSGSEPVISGTNGKIVSLGADGNPVPGSKPPSNADAADEAEAEAADAQGAGECGSHGKKEELSDKCVCDKNWGGAKCDRNIDCSGHGKRDPTDPETCLCKPYYYGDVCENLECSGAGKVTQGNCRCNPGFTGEKCESECGGHGSWNNVTTACECRKGYKGKQCNKLANGMNMRLKKGNIRVAGKMHVAGDVVVNSRAKSPLRISGAHATVSSQESMKLVVPSSKESPHHVAMGSCVRFGDDKTTTPCVKAALLTMRMPAKILGQTFKALPRGVSAANIVSITAMAMSTDMDTGEKSIYDTSNPITGDSYFEWWVQDTRLTVLRLSPKRSFDAGRCEVRVFITYVPSPQMAVDARENAAAEAALAAEASPGGGNTLLFTVQGKPDSIDSEEFLLGVSQALDIATERLVMGPITASPKDKATLTLVKVKLTNPKPGAEATTDEPAASIAERAERMTVQGKLLVGDYSIVSTTFKVGKGGEEPGARSNKTVTDADVARAIAEGAPEDVKLMFATKQFETDVRKQFAEADPSGIGAVDAKDLVKVIQALVDVTAKKTPGAAPPKSVDDDALAFVSQFDGDGDGHIEKNEFTNFVKVTMLANAVGRSQVQALLKKPVPAAALAAAEVARMASLNNASVADGSDDTAAPPGFFLEMLLEQGVMEEVAPPAISPPAADAAAGTPPSLTAAASKEPEAPEVSAAAAAAHADKAGADGEDEANKKKVAAPAPTPKEAVTPANEMVQMRKVILAMAKNNTNDTKPALQVKDDSSPGSPASRPDFSLDSSVTIKGIAWAAMSLSKTRSKAALRSAVKSDLANSLGLNSSSEDDALVALGKDAIRKSSDGASTEVYFSLTGLTHLSAEAWKRTLDQKAFLFPATTAIVREDEAESAPSGNGTNGTSGGGGGAAKRDISATLSVDFEWAQAHETELSDAFAVDMSKALGVTVDKVRVSGIAAGSTVVKATVQGTEACTKVASLAPADVVLTGVSKVAGKPIEVTKGMTVGEVRTASSDDNASSVSSKPASGTAGPTVTKTSVVNQTALDGQCSGHGTKNDAGKCKCECGYYGNDCQTYVKECSGHGCKDKSGQCACNGMWYGGDCSMKMCNLHGKKVAGKCECSVAGWSGEECEVECGGHGALEKGVCLCDEEYSGPLCMRAKASSDPTPGPSSPPPAPLDGPITVLGECEATNLLKVGARGLGVAADGKDGMPILRSSRIEVAEGKGKVNTAGFHACTRFLGPETPLADATAVSVPCVRFKVVKVPLPTKVHQSTTVDMGIEAGQVLVISPSMRRVSPAPGDPAAAASGGGPKTVTTISSDAHPMGAGLYYTYYATHNRLTLTRSAGAVKAAFDDAVVNFAIMYTGPAQKLPKPNVTSINIELDCFLKDLRISELKANLADTLKADENRFHMVGATVGESANFTSVRFKVTPPTKADIDAAADSQLASPETAKQLAVKLFKLFNESKSFALGNLEVMAVTYSTPNPPVAKKPVKPAAPPAAPPANVTQNVTQPTPVTCEDGKEFVCARNLRSCRNVARATQPACEADPGCGWSARARTCLPKALTNCLTMGNKACVEEPSCKWHTSGKTKFCASSAFARCAAAVDSVTCSAMPECHGGCVPEKEEPKVRRCPLTATQKQAGETEGVEPDFTCFRSHAACRKITVGSSCTASDECGWLGRRGCVNKQMASCFMINYQPQRGNKCASNKDCHWDGRICMSDKHVSCSVADSIEECKAEGGCSGRFRCPK